MHLTAVSPWLLMTLTADALIVWAVLELSTSDDGLITLLIPMVLMVGLIWWQTFRTPEMRREREMAARALTDHSDPGPQHRATVEALAQEQAADSRALSWLPSALLLVAVAAGAAAAVVRDEVGAVPPLLALFVAACWLPSWFRRRQLAASRWLDDPPYEQEHA